MGQYFKTFCQDNPEVCNHLPLEKCIDDLQFVDLLESIDNRFQREVYFTKFMDSYCQYKNGKPSKEQLQTLKVAFSIKN